MDFEQKLREVAKAAVILTRVAEAQGRSGNPQIVNDCADLSGIPCGHEGKLMYYFQQELMG